MSSVQSWQVRGTSTLQPNSGWVSNQSRPGARSASSSPMNRKTGCSPPSSGSSSPVKSPTTPARVSWWKVPPARVRSVFSCRSLPAASADRATTGTCRSWHRTASAPSVGSTTSSSPGSTRTRRAGRLPSCTPAKSAAATSAGTPGRISMAWPPREQAPASAAMPPSNSGSPSTRRTTVRPRDAYLISSSAGFSASRATLHPGRTAMAAPSRASCRSVLVISTSARSMARRQDRVS